MIMLRHGEWRWKWDRKRRAEIKKECKAVKEMIESGMYLNDDTWGGSYMDVWTATRTLRALSIWQTLKYCWEERTLHYLDMRKSIVNEWGPRDLEFAIKTAVTREIFSIKRRKTFCFTPKVVSTRPLLNK